MFCAFHPQEVMNNALFDLRKRHEFSEGIFDGTEIRFPVINQGKIIHITDDQTAPCATLILPTATDNPCPRIEKY